MALSTAYNEGPYESSSTTHYKDPPKSQSSSSATPPTPPPQFSYLPVPHLSPLLRPVLPSSLLSSTPTPPSSQRMAPPTPLASHSSPSPSAPALDKPSHQKYSTHPQSPLLLLAS